MANRTLLQGWLAPIVFFSRNWISRIGVAVVTTATVFWLFLLPASMRGEPQHPYIGILAYLILPGVFFSGLSLIPLGMWLQRRRARTSGGPGLELPPLTLRSPELRQLLLFIAITTFVNVVIGSQLSYRAILYMDSVSFCGQTCHQVMAPEHTAYQGSPHSRVECVACHIGPGASWFVQSKLSGLYQVYAVAMNNYPRPIPTPVHNLRPARETCEACHWPQKFAEDRLEIIKKYADDESNTMTETVLLMRISGGKDHPGIHTSHLGPGVMITYNPSDESRQTIPRVEYRNAKTGAAVAYTASDVKPEALKNLVTRQMDCMDCHNRPTHTFQLPERAVDSAMANGDIPAALPFIKKTAVEVLRKTYATEEEAAGAIPAAIDKFYQGRPDVYGSRRADVDRAGKAVLAIFNRNVFPHMRVTWGTYPNNIGHMDFPGCFRCHDGSHSTADGKAIPNDCNTCHQTLAMDEPSPKILSELGLENAAGAK